MHMKWRPDRHQFDFDDFCALVKDGQKADLIDGVIYMASPDNTEANDLNAWLVMVVRGYARRKKLGNVYCSRVALRLNKRNSPEPDLLFVKRERQHLVKRGYIDGPADLVMEIVSPDSIERDYIKKRRQYQRFGVPEYWIIDPLRRRVVFLRLEADGKYRAARAVKGVLSSDVLPGFRLRAAQLWRRPLPDELNVLAELFG